MYVILGVYLVPGTHYRNPSVCVSLDGNFHRFVRVCLRRFEFWSAVESNALDELSSYVSFTYYNVENIWRLCEGYQSSEFPYSYKRFVQQRASIPWGPTAMKSSLPKAEAALVLPAAHCSAGSQVQELFLH